MNKKPQLTAECRKSNSHRAITWSYCLYCSICPLFQYRIQSAWSYIWSVVMVSCNGQSYGLTLHVHWSVYLSHQLVQYTIIQSYLDT